ncbi:hypothetical protein GCM10010124_33180 [Pilimelia terevasa]|uniref:Uncharacterized protein n=1 Tax=Pilimelia terevasa TaxID=53372 RepID=A0A8J3FJ76_9ACTN|nr:hypothetical protein [Pilimelia terevasa]GGK37740.1 hypothetical protein GCM10010124_33180 [Pilimelia terevasa]
MSVLGVWGTVLVAVWGGPAAAPPADPAAALAAALPGADAEEVRAGLREAARSAGAPERVVARRILAEVEADRAQGAAEAAARPRGGSAGDRRLVPARRVGDAYYTPASTGGVDHGHVGLYTAVDQITESVVGQRVHTIPYHGRWVRPGAVLFEIRASDSQRGAASGWALSRVGRDAYSLNFATNRLTGHTGAKNCSKLIWSAYRVTGGMDLDANGGAGVYPRDVRDAAQSTTYRVIGR